MFSGGKTGFPSNVNGSGCAKFTSTSAICHGLWSMRKRRVSCAMSLGTAVPAQCNLSRCGLRLLCCCAVPLCWNAEDSLPLFYIKYLICVVPIYSYTSLLRSESCPKRPKSKPSPQTRKGLGGHMQAAVHGSMTEALVRHLASPIMHI